MIRINLTFILLFFLQSVTVYSQNNLRDSVWFKNEIFSVIYSEKFEQPLWLKYRSTNRPTLVNRGSMDFYTEKNIKTSDSDDYLKNVYDKGHLAPAASFSDNLSNLRSTFSYLNSVLQNQYLNRGEWRFLEEQERKWDDVENLTITVSVFFDKKSVFLTTGAKIPSFFKKHIYFEKQKIWKCFLFPNEKPDFKWQDAVTNCKSSEHRDLFVKK